LEPQVPFAVVALGRLGGAQLAYPSDLDLVFVHEGSSVAAAEEADRVATGLVRALNGTTPSDRIWAVDTTLRPEGRNGPLSRSLAGWRSYRSEERRVGKERSAGRAADPEEST